ncbi:MHYT domain-containing protein [Magnetovibrio sp.]|uniref:MHYT domain-containing protein n=1 Tax=Magnetovibrio sp. TaxID=2024836 RepID=UPI002F949FE1
MTSYFQFLTSAQDPSIAYLGTYDPVLVVVSILTAIFASFMALQLSGRISHASSFAKKTIWLAPGALAMGGGVWAMHFIGMLAFSLPCGISYDPLITLASMVPGILASAVALWVISHTQISAMTLALGGTLMGGGIGTMHYSGMAAMRLDAVIYYSPTLFALSICVAVLLAILALHAKFALHNRDTGLPEWALTLLSAVFMGGAVSGMHYIAMEAAFFIPAGDTSTAAPGLAPTVLAVGIGTVTVMVVALTLAATILAQHMETIAKLETEIQERKRAEDQIQRLSRAVEQSPAGVVMTDLNGTIVYVNSRFTEMNGYTLADVIGKSPRILKSGRTSNQEYANMWATISQGHEWRGELYNKRKDGSFYWEFLSISTIRDANGEPINYLGIQEDITETKSAMSALQHAKEDAEYANHVKSQFLASMSHELRTPLNAIIGFSEMVMSELFGPVGSPKYLEYTKDIHDSGEHLLELITDILDMSKIESGNLQLNESQVEISRIAETCRKLVNSRANDKDITLLADLPNPSPVVMGDSVRLKQIFINLLTNAVKYTPRGGDIAMDIGIDERGGLKITIADTGIGMSEEDIPRALEPFSQIGDIMSAPSEGVGLGLYLTRSLVEMHGGILHIDSSLGHGTTVTVSLPRSRVLDTGGSVPI